MAKTIDPQLAAGLREESEQTREAPFPSGVVPTRPDRLRSKVYSVRLSAEEQARVQRVADAKHLPASTLVRSWIWSAWTRKSPPEHASPDQARGSDWCDHSPDRLQLRLQFQKACVVTSVVADI